MAAGPWVPRSLTSSRGAMAAVGAELAPNRVTHGRRGVAAREGEAASGGGGALGRRRRRDGGVRGGWSSDDGGERSWNMRGERERMCGQNSERGRGEGEEKGKEKRKRKKKGKIVLFNLKIN